MRNNYLQGKYGSVNWLYFLLAVFTLAVFITGLFPETTVDSAKYAAVSREIFQSGDFIHLKIHGDPYLQKPPLLFWLGAILFKIFGVSIVAFKIPTLLFTFLGIYATYRLGRLIYDKKTGVIAAVIYSTSEALFLFNLDVHTDALMTANIIFGTWQLAEYLEKRRPLNYVLGFIGIGLAMISKGFIGFVIPVIAIGSYLLLKKDFKTIFSIRWFAGLLILLLILYPYFKGLYDQFGLDGLEFYFWSNNIDRIRGEYSHFKHDYFFSFHTLVYLFLPWSVYAYFAFVKDARQWYTQKFAITNKKVAYAYSVVIALMFIVSISSQQAPHYLLPAIPFISIITAKFIFDVSSKDLYPRSYKWMLIFRTLIVALTWPVSIVTMMYFFPTTNLLLWIPVLLLLLLQFYSYVKLKTKLQKLIIPPLISILLLSFVSNTVYIPSATKYHGPIQASYFFNRIAKDNATLYTYDYGQFETYFYPKNVSKIIKDQEQLNSLISEGSSFWLITTERGKQTIEAFDEKIITEQYIFPYKKLTNISLKFLNPGTRQKTLQNIYLLKIR